MMLNRATGTVLALTACLFLRADFCHPDENDSSIVKRYAVACRGFLESSSPSLPYPYPYPFRLEGNHGQAAADYPVIGRGDGYFFFSRGAEAGMDLRDASGGSKAVIAMKLVGAAPGRLETVGNGRVSYFFGSHAVSNAPVYEEVVYRGVYPGVDLIYYGKDGHLEHDFRLAAGVDPARIRWQFSGVDRVRIDGDVLLLEAGGATVRWQAPIASQGSRRVAARYLQHADGTIGFAVPERNPREALVIDPVMQYLTYLGRRGGELGGRSTVDAQGNLYMVGATTDGEYPNTPGAPINRLGFGPSNILLTKFDATGSRIVYSTYLGGGSADIAAGVAVDATGAVYLTGVTDSPDFPVSANAFQKTVAEVDKGNCFVTKLNAAGSAIVYSTYLGGKEKDGCIAIAVDRNGAAVVTGGSESTDFPTTPDSIQSRYRLGQGEVKYDVIVSKLNPAGSALEFSTFIGGSGSETGHGVALDAAGNIYVTGVTNSTSGFPVTPGAIRTAYAGQGGSPEFYTIGDAFLFKLNPTGTTMLYSTMLGGSRDDSAFGVTVDAAGNAYVVGNTLSRDFPVTTGATWKGEGGQLYLPAGDVFVTKVNPTGTAIVYSTLLGGSKDDRAVSIALAPDGSAHIVGHTLSSDFPVTVDAAQLQNRSTNTTADFQTGDGFYVQLDPSGGRVLYSTYVGGADNDWLSGIAIDAAGAVTVTGNTSSANLAVTPGAYQGTYYGAAASLLPAGDLMVARFGAGAAVVVSAVTNAASYAGGAVSPGLIVTIFGSGLGPETLTGAAVASGALTTTVAETRVFFDGIPAPILYVSAKQTSVVVPYAVKGNTEMVVEYRGVRSAPLVIPVVATQPGLFATVPAQRGGIVTLYATGEGQTNPPGQDGRLVTAPLPLPLLPVEVTIAGQRAEVLYAGGAPGLTAGLLQINVRVPSNTPVGTQPVVLKVGTAESQRGATLAIQ